MSLLLEETQCPEDLEDAQPEVSRRVRLDDTPTVHQVASYSSVEESNSGSSGSRSEESSSPGSTSGDSESGEL